MSSTNGFDEYGNYGDYLDQISPRARKNMGKKKFHVYDDSGNLILPAMNKFPACAAKKAVSKGYKKVVVYDPVKNRWYGYIGKKVKIPSNKLTQHQLDMGMKFLPKAYSHKIEDVAKPEFLKEILGLKSQGDVDEYVYHEEIENGDYEGCEEDDHDMMMKQMAKKQGRQSPRGRRDNGIDWSMFGF